MSLSIANYQIEKRIGKGQFSEVFRAKHPTAGIVALKKIPVPTAYALHLLHTDFVVDFWNDGRKGTEWLY